MRHTFFEQKEGHFDIDLKYFVPSILWTFQHCPSTRYMDTISCKHLNLNLTEVGVHCSIGYQNVQASVPGHSLLYQVVPVFLLTHVTHHPTHTVALRGQL